MAIVVLKLPAVKQRTEVRPSQCPYCGGNTFQRWGAVNKSVKDVRVRNVQVYRYRCCRCKRTFRHYPVGSTRADQTERLRLFAIVLWSLGLSHRASSLILSGLQVLVSFITIWRDVQEESKQLKQRKQWKPVRILGLDGAYVLGWGEKQPVLVAVDLGTGEPLALGYVNEYDPQAIRRWLAPLVQQHGISVIVTDDLFSYKVVAEKLQLAHQVCQFHVRRWVGKHSKICKQPSPRNGCGSWRKFGSCWNSCHRMAIESCMRSGSNCQVAVHCLRRLVLPWNNYVIYFYGSTRIGSAIVLSNPNLPCPGPIIQPNERLGV